MRHTLLFLPGNNPGNLQSGAVFGADGIILDLEDSVSPAEKDAARLLVASALKSVDYAGVERAVRINTLAAGGEADIAAVVPCGPDAVMLPKTESIDDIRACEALLEKAEAACGAAKKTLIMPLIETPMGLARCLEIALASKRVTLLSLGGEDYTASLGTQRTREGRELIFTRGMLANAAAAGLHRCPLRRYQRSRRALSRHSERPYLRLQGKVCHQSAPNQRDPQGICADRERNRLGQAHSCRH